MGAPRRAAAGAGEAVRAAGLPAAVPCRDPDPGPGTMPAADNGAGVGAIAEAPAAPDADEDEECTDLFAVSAEEQRTAGSGGCDLAVLVRATGAPLMLVLCMPECRCYEGQLALL